MRSNYSQAIKLSVLCAVFAALVVSYFFIFRSTPKKQLQQNLPLSATNCSLKDQSFCDDQTKFQNLVKVNDFSDILENESAKTVSCTGSQKSMPYCTGVQSTLPIDTFQLIENNRGVYLSRNQFIQTLMNYVSSYGPLKFSSTSIAGSSANMLFMSSSPSHALSLQFDKSSGVWKLIAPRITLN